MIKFIKNFFGNREIIGISAEWLFHYEDIRTGRKWTVGPTKNKIVQGGLTNMASLLIGDRPSETAAMHCVIGSSDIPADISDTLTDMSEVARKAITSKSRTGTMARLRTMFGTSEGNGDHQCVGIVARSTDAAGSGTLLNRLVQPFSKTDSAVLIIEVRWTFTGVN